MKTVNILGIEYKVIVSKIGEDKEMRESSAQGICNYLDHIIKIADFNDDEYFPNNTENEKERLAKETLQHEIIHAFFSEIGLRESSVNVTSWATNEEMVDWIALQFPKLLKVFQESECL